MTKAIKLKRQAQTMRVRVPLCRVCDRPILGVVWRGPECVGCAIEGARQALVLADLMQRQGGKPEGV